VRRTSKGLALIALGVAVVIAAFALYTSGGRDGSARDADVDFSKRPRGSLVLTWVRTGESFPIRRRCGLIRFLGRPVDVDIVEGRFPLTCGAARAVMSRYLARRFVRYGTVRHARLTFECYESRPDGVGWEFHCMTNSAADEAAYVDVGAGRRPYRVYPRRLGEGSWYGKVLAVNVAQRRLTFAPACRFSRSRRWIAVQGNSRVPAAVPLAPRAQFQIYYRPKGNPAEGHGQPSDLKQFATVALRGHLPHFPSGWFVTVRDHAAVSVEQNSEVKSSGRADRQTFACVWSRSTRLFVSK
jgi:hypothetical protein